MAKWRQVRALAGVVLAVGVVFSLYLAPRAQVSSITFAIGGNPNFTGSWPAGPDYATDVLGDPWDFSNSEDIGLDPSETQGWSSFSVNSAVSGMAGGHTTTVSGAVDSTLSLLYSGRYGDINPGKNGRRFPIDTSRFQKIALRMTNSGSAETVAVYWFHSPWLEPGTTNRDYGGKFIGQNAAGGEKILVLDLAASSPDDGAAWNRSSTDVVRGLRLDPNTVSANADVFFDWVRLTTKDNASDAANVTISWSDGSGPATVDVVDAGGTVYNIASTSQSSTTWNYGVLPPGNYTMRVTRNGVPQTRAFTINNPPLAQVTNPDETGGEDYATTVLGNAWDMSSSSDVVVTGTDGYTPTGAGAFSGGTMTATNTNDDANVTLLNETNNSTPIDTTKYRYLTYGFQVDGAFDLFCGSVVRVFWDSSTFMNGATSTTTTDIVIWPGMNSYTIDLGALSTAADGGLVPDHGTPEAWTSGSKRHFRFDPHEFGSTAPLYASCDPTRTFHIDDVKLAAMDETANSQFTIKWSGSDADGTDAGITLYYDTDTNASNGKTQIQSGLLVSQGTTGWNWDTSAVTPGTYYIYIEANDGVQTAGRYSTGTIRVVDPNAGPNPAMTLEAPANGVTILQPFTLSGWAVDLGAASGTGVDQVRVTATSSTGAVTQLGDATLFVARSDACGGYGSQFINCGFTKSVTGLSPGTYTITASAHSTVSSSFNQSRSATITIPAGNPAMHIDSPASQSTVGRSFTMSGWAVDRGDPTGTGIVRVNLWAYPIDSLGQVTGDPTNLGSASYGSSRPDIAAAFGSSQFTNSGFSATISTLSDGMWRVFAYAESTVTLTTNNEQSVDVTVSGPVANPQMSVDGPANNSTVRQPFLTGGWAVDLGATSGAGVSDIHVWAFPIVNGSVDTANGIFVVQGTIGGYRPDVGDVFGRNFDYSGFTFVVSGLAPGEYQLNVYALSTVTNTFNNMRTARITVPSSNGQMSLDGPASGSTISQPFITGGWAVDLSAGQGIGISDVHIYAFPIVDGVVDAANPIFITQGRLGGIRTDVGDVFGRQFDASGFTFTVASPDLVSGQTYLLRAYGLSTVSGGFSVWRDAIVTIQ